MTSQTKSDSTIQLANRETCSIVTTRKMLDLIEALTNAPIVSKFDNAEAFIAAYEEWRDQYKVPALRLAAL